MVAIMRVHKPPPNFVAHTAATKTPARSLAASFLPLAGLPLPGIPGVSRAIFARDTVEVAVVCGLRRVPDVPSVSIHSAVMQH